MAKYVLKFPVQVGLVRIGMVWNVPARNGPGIGARQFYYTNEHLPMPKINVKRKQMKRHYCPVKGYEASL